jgi:hypothetical protein
MAMNDEYGRVEDAFRACLVAISAFNKEGLMKT